MDGDFRSFTKLFGSGVRFGFQQTLKELKSRLDARHPDDFDSTADDMVIWLRDKIQATEAALDGLDQ